LARDAYIGDQESRLKSHRVLGKQSFLCLTPGVNYVVWIRNLLSEMKLGYACASTVYTDNNNARILAENPVHHSRMKQISVKYFLIRELVNLCVVTAGRIATDLNPADFGTKPLGRAEFIRKVDMFFSGLDSLYQLGFTQIERPLLVSNEEYS
jgi:hypothetical protein